MNVRFNSVKIKPRNILFILLVIVYCSTASDEIGNNSSLYKYFVLFLCVLEAFFGYIKKYKKKNIFLTNEFKALMLVICVICIYTMFRSVLVEKFSFRTIQEILFLAFPMFYAYFGINVFDKRDLSKNMKIGFWITFLFYLISLDLNINSIIKALFNSSFSNSSSDLESHVFCGMALAFCMYFCYFDEKKIYKFISLLFVIMTFKRLFIVMSVFIFVLSFFKVKEKVVPKKVVIFTTISLIFLTVAYFYIIQPVNVNRIESKYNIDISKLTSTRSDRLRMLENSSYISYGFGSSTEYMYNNFGGALEMDFVKIIIELGYIPVFVLIICYLRISKTNYYTFSFMIFQILNLIFSYLLIGAFTWSLIFLTLFEINRNSQELKEKIHG